MRTQIYVLGFVRTRNEVMPIQTLKCHPVRPDSFTRKTGERMNVKVQYLSLKIL